MKTIQLDDVWSIKYDPEKNDRPVKLFRYDDEVDINFANEKNYVLAMFYALLAATETPEKSDPKIARLYLAAPRKGWYHEVPAGWMETHWERFNIIECGIYEKPIDQLTQEDRALVIIHGLIPDEWVAPSKLDEPRMQ